MLNNKPSCVLIGSTTLLIQCAKVLIENHWEIKVIISKDKKVATWSTENQIKHCSTESKLKSTLLSLQYDFLFSIVNGWVLDGEMIEWANILSINYHDSLLPKYAGMYATFWAVHHQEKSHGISWHIIDEGIDTGDILVQREFKISNGETTLSLNTKCYENAILGFKTLIDKIQTDSLLPKPQDKLNRTYNGLNKRPENVGLINFSQSASTILSEINAYEFGENYSNPIGSPKIILNNELFILEDVAILPEPSVLPIGSIYKIEKDGILINTADELLSIKTLRNIYGARIKIDNLSISDRQMLNPTVGALHEFYTNASKRESYWINRLLNLDILEFPLVHKMPHKKKTLLQHTFRLNGVEEFLGNETNQSKQYIAILFLYLSRLADKYNFDIGFYHNQFQYLNLFTKCFPLKIEVEQELSLKENIELLATSFEKKSNQLPYLNDIVYRNPILKDNISADLIKDFRFSISIDQAEIASALQSKCWHINFNSKDGCWQLFYPNEKSNIEKVESFVSRFNVFIEQGIKLSNQPIENIPIISTNEANELIFERNSSTTFVPNEKCLHHLFEESAAENPNEIAVVLGSELITYADLNHKANVLAYHLSKNGIKPKSSVGIFLDRTIENIISMLGILKAGGCYVPLHIDYPIVRLNHMIEDAGVQLIISNEQLKDRLNQHKNILSWEALDFDLDLSVDFSCTTSDLAYVIYTSGSSGLPKGVAISHFNVVNFLYSIRSFIDLEERRITAVAAPFSFDVSVEEIFSTICFGGTAHIIPKTMLTNSKALVEYIYDNRVNTMFIIPTLLDKIASNFTTTSIQYFKCLLSGVQSKKNSSFQKFRALSPSLKIINTYGPTEVTFGPSGYFYIGNENDNEDTPIGRPFPNYSMYVVDRHNQIVPDYVKGELLIGGNSVSSGYLNKPELTESKFVTTDFGEEGKKYKSGDLVYSDKGGNIHFVGRKDNQVKINGFRIEIAAIENSIMKIEGIKNCIVVAKKVNQEHEQLVSYLKFEHKKLKIEDVKRQLTEILPSYAIPSFVLEMNKIPLTSNGKTNFQKLPDVKQQLSVREIVLPINETEAQLYTIWATVLKEQSISTADNFFEIGGDSLSAAEIIIQFQKVVNEQLSIAMFYNFPTIKAFSNAFIRDAGFYSSNSLTKLREGNQSKPIFFIHSINGSIAVLNHIIDALETENAIYCFQASSTYKAIDSLISLAKIYVEQIVVRDVKDCTICGYSFGGILGFEMVNQLKEKGINTKLIVLDSKPIIMYKKQRKLFYRIVYGLKVGQWILRGFAAAFKERNTALLFDRINKLRKRIEPELLAGVSHNNDGVPANIYQEILLQSRRMANQYRPSKCNIDLVLVKALKEKEGFIGFGFSKNSWGFFTKGNIEIETIDIHHYDFGKKEHAAEIAEMIQKHI